MFILDLLWGKKSIIHDGYFGEMTSNRSRQKDLNKEVTWYCEKQIHPFNTATFIILEGNYCEPNPTQKQTLYDFFEAFNATHSIQIDLLIAKDERFNPLKNWRSTYFLSQITPIINTKNQFEICFEHNDTKNNLGFFSFQLHDNSILNLSL